MSIEMSPIDHEKARQTEEEKQQDASFRYYLRLNRIYFLVVLAICAIFTAFKPTSPRLIGMAFLIVLTGIVFLFNRVSLRTIGFALLATAVLTAAIAEIARPDWPMQPNEFGIIAVSIGALALGLIFINKSTGETDPRFENIAGVLSLIALFSVTGIIIWAGTAYITRPAGLVMLEALAALASLAGKRWQWHLSLISLLPIAGLLAEHIQPQWRPLVLHALTSAWSFLTAHTHAWMFWPILFAGMSSVIDSINRRLDRRTTLFHLFVIVTLVWLVLFMIAVSV